MRIKDNTRKTHAKDVINGQKREAGQLAAPPISEKILEGPPPPRPLPPAPQAVSYQGPVQLAWLGAREPLLPSFGIGTPPPVTPV